MFQASPPPRGQPLGWLGKCPMRPDANDSRPVWHRGRDKVKWDQPERETKWSLSAFLHLRLPGPAPQVTGSHPWAQKNLYPR